MVHGESLIATAGLFAAAILVFALGCAAWWSVHSYSHAVETSRRERAHAVAQLLARNAAGLLATDNTTGVQRMIDEATRTQGFDACQVTVPALDNRVIADADPAAVLLLDALPEKWGSTGGATAAETGESNSTDAGGRAEFRVPIAVPSRGLAELRVVDNPRVALSDAWPLQAGIGVIGAGAMGALWLAYRAMRSRLRALGAIGEALKTPNVADAAHGDLCVSPDLGPEAAAWNRLVADRERLREYVAGKLTAEKLSSRRSRDGELGSVCDGLWLGLLLVDEQLKVKYVNGAASVFLRARREELQGADLARAIEDRKVLDAIRGVAAGSIRNRVISEVRRQPDAGDAPALAPGGDAGAGSGGTAGASVLRITVRPLRREDSAIALVVVEDVTQQRVADEARNSFVAQATHELRTPLTNIRLYVEMLVEGGAEDAKKRSDALNVISQESRRLERIVGDMLSLSEIEAGSLKLNRDDVRINTVFEEIEHDFREQAQAKEVRLRFDLPPKLPVLMGDRDKIVMALHNLVGNAVKYTPAGGEVVVRVGEEKGQLTVDVTDTGIGIRDEERELIFEKFYRAKDRRITNVTGTGLGLAIAREVVRMHGGDITVRSQLDKGSTFTMTLPAAA